MSLMLKQGIEGLVGAVLVALLLAALLPTVAHAQEVRGAAVPREAVVVSPGDTLWSITEDHLGPGAGSREIARETERIYALNQDQIGPDPNLIISGQVLSLPAAGGSSADNPPTKRTAQTRTKSVASGNRSAKERPSEHQANLPKVPATAAVSPVKSLSSDTPPSTVAFALRSAVLEPVGTFADAQSAANGRRLLGWGIIALTLLVGALMAWKLPMKRSLSYREFAEVWGMYPGYRGPYHAYWVIRDLHPSAPRPTSTGAVLEPSGAESSVDKWEAESTAEKNSVNSVGSGGIAQTRRQTTDLRSKGLLHKRRSAAEVHSAEFRRLLRGAVLGTRARKPRRNGGIKTARLGARGGRQLWRKP